MLRDRRYSVRNAPRRRSGTAWPSPDRCWHPCDPLAEADRRDHDRPRPAELRDWVNLFGSSNVVPSLQEANHALLERSSKRGRNKTPMVITPDQRLKTSSNIVPSPPPDICPTASLAIARPQPRRAVLCAQLRPDVDVDPPTWKARRRPRYEAPSSRT